MSAECFAPVFSLLPESILVNRPAPIAIDLSIAPSGVTVRIPFHHGEGIRLSWASATAQTFADRDIPLHIEASVTEGNVSLKHLVTEATMSLKHSATEASGTEATVSLKQSLFHFLIIIFALFLFCFSSICLPLSSPFLYFSSPPIFLPSPLRLRAISSSLSLFSIALGLSSSCIPSPSRLCLPSPMLCSPFSASPSSLSFLRASLRSAFSLSHRLSLLTVSISSSCSSLTSSRASHPLLPSAFNNLFFLCASLPLSFPFPALPPLSAFHLFFLSSSLALPHASRLSNALSPLRAPSHSFSSPTPFLALPPLVPLRFRIPFSPSPSLPFRLSFFPPLFVLLSSRSFSRLLRFSPSSTLLPLLLISSLNAFPSLSPPLASSPPPPPSCSLFFGFRAFPSLPPLFSSLSS
ncbi:hypothetical protein C7M84_009847 [Penaeus vannamei]|uniref:Uncharacterized protein n=1 Tax=Penaeus vannamei TaxID=6689 RepID=A0A3R7P0C9_PENVA|nr:hypothetical protein C7M84_009847 [Penaeus vannamei]